MENYNNIDINKILLKKIDEESKKIEPSELAISLRKKKINKIISKNRILNIKKDIEEEFGNKELEKLCDLSKLLYEEKNISKIIDILDQLYFFFLNFNIPIETNYIDISTIIQHLYTKIIKYKDNEKIVSKIFDVFDQIIRLTPYEEEEKFCRIFNSQYFQIIYELINYHQNNIKIIEKIFHFLITLNNNSDKIKELLMKNPGLYLIQTIFSLDTKYPTLFIKLITSFCSYKQLDDEIMKDFEIIFIEKCDKIISLFYQENHNEPKDVINNIFIFQSLFRCLAYISQSINNEILDVFLINKKNDITLYEKLLTFVKFDEEHLSFNLLNITGNLFCSSKIQHIQTLIECKSYEWVMKILLQKFYNNNNIIKNAAWALSNFVNVEIYRIIFLNQNYIKDLIEVLKDNNCYEVKNELLSVLLNLLDALNEDEIYSVIGSNIIRCCCEFLINLKEPNLLKKILLIIKTLLEKGNPNTYLNPYYKNSNNKVTNVLKYRFDKCGLENILNEISFNNKHTIISDIAQLILNHFYK